MGRAIVVVARSNPQTPRVTPEPLGDRNLDRRRFLAKSAIGAGVAGAAWITPSLDRIATPAAAASLNCTPAGTYTVNWASFANGAPGAATGFYPWTVATLGGTSLVFSWLNSTAYLDWTTTTPAPGPTGARPTQQTGNTTGIFTILKNGAPYQDLTTLRMAFSHNVRNLAFTILDIDYSNTTPFIDQVQLRAFLNGSAVLATYTPSGGTGAFGCIGATLLNPSGSTTSSALTTYTGTAPVGNTCTRGNLAVSVAGPVDRFDLGYLSNWNGTAGTQQISLSNITWRCV